MISKERNENSDMELETPKDVEGKLLKKSESDRLKIPGVLLKQILLTLAISTAMVSASATLAFSSIFLPQVRQSISSDEIHMNAESESWYASLNNLASPLGSIVAGIILDKYGRRTAILLPLIPTVIAWIATAISKTVTLVFMSRFVLGFCGGFGPLASQVYLAECTDPFIRGVTINVGHVSISFGFLLTLALGSIMYWRLVAWIFIILPTTSLISIAFLPETPLWLVRHDRVEKAMQNLLWLRGDKSIAEEELNNIKVRFEREQFMDSENNNKTNSIWSECMKRSTLKPIIIISLFLFLFNATGTYLIVFYAVDIIADLHLTINANAASVILAVIRLVVTIGFCLLFLRSTRRSIYLLSGFGSTLSTICLGFYLLTQRQSEPSTYDTIIIGTLFTLYIVTNTGFLMAPGCLIGELLPAKIRGRLAGYIYTLFSAIIFILTKIFPMLSKCIGISGIMFIFGFASLATTALVYFMVPETKGKSLDEIEDHFENSGWIHRRKR